MTRKLTLNELALWAALPMAHTPRLEGRLTQILDKTRSRRAPTRRALLIALGAAAAALVPLAMLQPVARAQAAPPKLGASAPEDVAAATKHLRQIYTYIGIYRRTHGGRHPATYGPDCLAADMAAAPRRYGLPDLGAGNSEQAERFFTGPGRQTVSYILHNKRPDGTFVGTPKRAGGRDVFADTGLFVHGNGTGGFWLVLWDDGTVGKIPARDMLAVRAYDVIGPPGMTEAARREGEKQMAFPGQAGLPRG